METPVAGKKWLIVTIASCCVLLILFGSLSYSAAITKNATYDESLHLVAGYVHRTLDDFRINPEDPALFGYWASIPHGKNSIFINRDLKSWDGMIEDFASNQWPFVMNTLYRTPKNDGDGLLQESRFMFTLMGIALGGLIAWWSWKLAGAGAAIFATALFALDPNFLAHSSLVKNDVMLSFMMALMAMSLWKFGQKGTWPWLVALSLSCAAAVNVKFSGVLCGPIVLISLTIRALLPQAWTVVGKNLMTRWQRLIVVPAACVVVGLTTYVATWACYGFRFAPTADPDALLNTPRIVKRAKVNLVALRVGVDQPVTQDLVDQQKNTLIIDVIVWAESKHLLPQAWLHGFLYTYATTMVRGSFLLGELKSTGWWYYFPCVMLFKTPTATLAMVPLTILAALEFLVHLRQSQHKINWWAITCLGLTPLLYFGSAMTTNLNLGLRHILPVYPFIFVTIGTIWGLQLPRWKRVVPVIMAAAVVGVACESLPAYPNYIPFFNTPSGGWRGGINLLGDSNLDWGQDLKQLGQWQKSHPGKMYLSYFGVPDPEYYGVQAVNLPGGWSMFFEPSLPFYVPAPGEECYVVISATNLQGIYFPKNVRDWYDQFKSYKPVDVLGGSIYIYHLPLKADDKQPY